MRGHKICLVSHIFPCNGQDYKGIFVRDLAVALRQRGHEVHVVTPMRPGAVKEEDFKGVLVHRYGYWGWQKGIQLGQLNSTPILLLGSLMALGIIKCLKSIYTYHLNLIHAYWVVPSGLISLIVGWLTRRPVIATAAGSDLTVASQHPLVRMCLAFTLKHLGRLLPVSSSMKKMAVELGLPEDKATVIHGPVGIDKEVLSQTPKKPLSGQQRQSLLYVGNLAPPKRADTIIRAMPKVIGIYPGCHLMLIGEGGLRAPLEALADELGVRGHVHFRGALAHEEVLRVLKEADLFVHCSDQEGLGIAIMEAMGASLPVVASRVGGVTDLVQEGETGFMLSPNDVDGYGDKILLLLGDHRLRERLGASGRRFALSHLSKDTILTQLEKVYRELAHMNKAR